MSGYRASEVGHEIQAEKDYEEHNLCDILGGYKNQWISWCKNRRLEGKGQLWYEVEFFIRDYLNKRIDSSHFKDWKKITRIVFKRDNYTCVYCGKKKDNLEVDHIIPISKSGSNRIENLATSCQKCNRQKNNKTPIEFIKWKLKRENNG